MPYQHSHSIGGGPCPACSRYYWAKLSILLTTGAVCLEAVSGALVETLYLTPHTGWE